MKTKPSLLFIAVLALALAFTVSSPAQEKKKFTNEQVLKMIKAELPESTIILAIESDPDDLDTSVDGLIALKEGGASKPILDAIAGAKAKKEAASPPAAPAVLNETPSLNEAVLVQGETRTKLMQGGEMKASGNPFSGSKLRQVFRGARSPARFKSGEIALELFIMSNMRPEETVFLVRPELKKDERRVETMRASGFMVVSTSSGNKELVPVKYEKVGEASMPGMTAPKYRLTPAAKLEPGEYVLMANHQFFDFGVD
ncbi:MAG TPA: hypothetical protein DCY13_17085 [Verrucomicrobiales bacterium]|nr:hypothetical protein [Verrucomicrobiales bacterium]